MPLISFVIPCYNEAEGFAELREALAAMAGRLPAGYEAEFILIDDGSCDGTWEDLKRFAADDVRVRAVGLSRNFGHQNALSCGYDLAEGDAVISLDADLQDPPDTVLELVREWERGADIVHAVRTARPEDTRFKRWTAAAFYRLFRALTGSSVPANAGDFRLISRRSLTAFRALREQHRYIRGMVGWIGFRTAEVPYVRQARRRGRSKYSLPRMVRLAVDAIVSFSFLPLRLAYVWAIAVSSVILTYLAYVLIRWFCFGATLVPGWASLLVCITLFGFLNLFCLGVLGEYVGRLYEQSKQRPLYLIRDVAGRHAPASKPMPDASIS